MCWLRSVQIFKRFKRREKAEISIRKDLSDSVGGRSGSVGGRSTTSYRGRTTSYRVKSLDPTKISTLSRRLNIFKLCTLPIQQVFFAIIKFSKNLECDLYEKSKIQNSKIMETGF